ncbi:MAG: NAD(P)H-dependent glycerol-3-phosphate dehydrogenase [Bacillota bacterium]
MNKKIAIIGAGSMGCAMAALLSWNGHEVSLWSPDETEIAMLQVKNEHLTRLPGVRLPQGIKYFSDFAEAVKSAEVVVLAIPSQTTRANAKRLAGCFGADVLIVTCSKGIEEGTCKLLTEIIAEELPNNKIAVLSGPSHAEEIARQVPTVVVAASEDLDIAEVVQGIFMSDTFRVYTNTDVVGVELGGAIKNVIALCAGISDGLGYGDNTKAALMTRGMYEIAQMGMAMGASPATFYGLTGMGDLIVTCTSLLSRNRKAGMLIGQGKTAEEALAEVKMVVEGYASCKPVYQLAQQHGISMPITQEAYRVLFEGKDPRIAVQELMTRKGKNEG